MVFGLLEILAVAALGWAVVRGARYLRRPHDGGRFPSLDRRDLGAPIQPGQPPERSHTTEVLTRTGEQRTGQSTPSYTQKLSPLAQREERINQLRRRYVNDEISVEEYEAELDRLMRE